MSLFELWGTADFTTTSSVLIDNDTIGFIDEFAQNHDIDAASKAIIEKTINSTLTYSFSLETYFDDGFILVSSEHEIPAHIKDVIQIELPRTQKHLGCIVER